LCGGGVGLGYPCCLFRVLAENVKLGAGVDVSGLFGKHVDLYTIHLLTGAGRHFGVDFVCFDCVFCCYYNANLYIFPHLNAIGGPTAITDSSWIMGRPSSTVKRNFSSSVSDVKQPTN